MTSAHARPPHHAHTIAEPDLEIGEKLRCPGEFAAEAVADADGDPRRGGLSIHDDVEMGVERGNLVDLDQRQPHLLGQRRQMARMQAAEMVLQQMQVLDQEIAPPLTIAEQRLHLGESRWIDLPALGVIGTSPPSRARMDAAVVFWGRWHRRP